MTIKKTAFIIIIIIIIVALGYYFLFKGEIKSTSPEPEQTLAITSFIPDAEDTLTVMNWNIQTFGKAKWNKSEVRNRILSIIPMADITATSPAGLAGAVLKNNTGLFIRKTLR